MKTTWRIACLGEVLTQDKQYVHSLEAKEYAKLSVKLYGRGCVVDGFARGDEVRMQRHQLAKPGQVILSEIWGKKGAIGLVPADGAAALVTSHFFLFDLDESHVSRDWLSWLFRANYFEPELSQKARGSTGYAAVRPRQFLDLTFPLPPLDEQRRIVARIEALAERIAKAERLQALARGEGDAMMISVLGKMRRNLLESAYPKSRIEDVTKVTSGGTPSRADHAYWGGKIPWVKTGELLDGDISESEEHITEKGLRESSAKLFPPETVLIALYGQGQTRGRTGRLLIEASTNQACCAIFPTPALLAARFTQYWLRSLYAELREEAHGGAQPNWNAQMIKDIEIAIPTLGEQRRLVSELDRLEVRIAAVRRLQQSAQVELAALLPAVLDKAFRGEL